MALFSAAVTEQINQIAAKSNEQAAKSAAVNSRSMNDELNEMSKKVVQYFEDSPAILITSKEQLHDYVSACIEKGFAGIDTETTGLDRIHDTIVGASLYTPGSDECYVPMKHLVPLFDTPYKNQLSYEEVGKEFQRLVDGNVKLIFANADFDLAMIYKDLKVDMIPAFYYDVISAWRCLREDEKDNSLKGLYAKYVKKGKIDPQKFSDFFSPKLFPNCKPQIAALYAANDAKITYELFLWQLPYITKDHPKCQKNHLEKIADLIWNLEFPMVGVCAQLHRRGVYLDDSITLSLHKRYDDRLKEDQAKLSAAVQELIDTKDIASNRNRPFKTGSDFNPNSNPHVKYLLNNLLGSSAKTTGKEVLKEINAPSTKAVLAVRGDVKLLSTYVDKMPRAVAPDHRIHASFKSIGADCITGDSILPTSTGYYTIQDICESRDVQEGVLTDVPDDLYIINKDQQLEKATGIIRYTDVPTVRITTECGLTIEGTPHHPVMVSKYTADDNVHGSDSRLSSFWDSRFFKKLEDLQPGDYIEIPCNFSTVYNNNTVYQPTNLEISPTEICYQENVKIPYIFDENFAEFLGMYYSYGVGRLYRRDNSYFVSILISIKDKDVSKRFTYLCRELFNVCPDRCRSIEASNKDSLNLECNALRYLYNMLFREKLHKNIPEAIKHSPVSVINAYIRGMTLGSSIHVALGDRLPPARFELTLPFKVRADARFIQYHLLSQGILASFNSNDKKAHNGPSLTFNCDNYTLFCNQIGFVEQSKIRHSLPCSKNKYSSRRIGDSFRLKITSVEHTRNTVYDLHVPRTHSFISNGMISHNTGRMSSQDPNLQNISSHALDIRHMFRATPEQTELIDVAEQDSKISFTLGLYDSIKTDEGLTKVKDIKEGTVILLRDNNKPVEFVVTSTTVQHGKATIFASMKEMQQ